MAVSTQIASSLDKSLALLFAFADPDDDQQVFTVSGLAEQQGMDKAQVSRILATFAKYGLVERLEQRRGYQLGWSIVHLASRALTAQTMSSLYPVLTRLADEWEETVHFSVRDGAHAVALASFEPDRRLYVRVPVGRRDALVGSAVGYVLLSRSDDGEVRSVFDETSRRTRIEAGSWGEVRGLVEHVRAAGYSMVVNERDDQITTVAVPIHDVGNYRDRVYAAVAVSAPDERIGARRDELVERLLGVASEANAFLQGREAGQE
ncbi:MAG: IclR family transcriptional regulator [Nocardioidaceae bacterium]